MLPKAFDWVNHFQKYDGNPILRPQGYYAADCIFNPGAIATENGVEMICRCINFSMPKPKGNWSVSSLVWAHSKDGLHFELDDEAFLPPRPPYEGGFEDPRLVYMPDEKVYALTYTGVYGLSKTVGLLALSKDLKTWEFLGECFPGRAIAITDRKINGKYWAYYGNSSIFSAWSEDLRSWHTEEKPVISPREGLFDGVLCEAVCAPIIEDEGILLLYNGAAHGEYRKNAAKALDAPFRGSVQDHIYSIGWVLFDRNDPEKVIDRCEEPILSPNQPYELYGIAEYTVFGQAVVPVNGKKYLYYGCSDTRIAVAIAE